MRRPDLQSADLQSADLQLAGCKPAGVRLAGLGRVALAAVAIWLCAGAALAQGQSGEGASTGAGASSGTDAGESTGTGAEASTGAAAGEAQLSCSLLAQVATTTWLEMAGTLGGGDGAGLDAAAARLADIVSIHADLGCDTAALRATTDCLLDRAGTASPRALARTCLTEAGILEE